MRNKNKIIKKICTTLFVALFLFHYSEVFALDSLDTNVSENDVVRMTDDGVTVGGQPLTQDGVITKDRPATQAPTSSPKQFKYILLEDFPGFFSGNTEMTDFPALVLAIYKFGIWTVGIAGLFMLVVGGFMYLASAGNTSTASSAQGIISDALLGITAALGAYLILYVINPDLTKISLNFTKVTVTESLGIGVNGGNCAVLHEGPCAVENLQNTCFGSNAEAASKACNYESGGRSDNPSRSDIGADGNVFSWGLFQINLTQHSLAGYNCEAAFNGKNYNSRITNQAMYDKCKTAANTAMININYACSISGNGKNWQPWENTKKACNL